jgi:hypothetical protein
MQKPHWHLKHDAANNISVVYVTDGRVLPKEILSGEFLAISNSLAVKRTNGNAKYSIE